jgi:hypothetical protein
VPLQALTAELGSWPGVNVDLEQQQQQHQLLQDGVNQDQQQQMLLQQQQPRQMQQLQQEEQLQAAEQRDMPSIVFDEQMLQLQVVSDEEEYGEVLQQIAAWQPSGQQEVTTGDYEQQQVQQWLDTQAQNAVSQRLQATAPAQVSCCHGIHRECAD